MKVLLVCNDFYHPSEVVTAGLAPLTEYGIDLTATADATEFASFCLKDYSVIIFSKSNNINAENTQSWLTPEIQQRFVDYVEAGGGLLVTHSGMAGYDNDPLFTELTGCMFLEHPDQCPVTVTMLKKHPITEGVESFTEIDEHYFIDVLDRDVDIFMTTTSTHGTQVGGYTKQRGKGRVCALTPGHNVWVWLNANNQILLRNAISWCGMA